jgi:hypothetical protein
VEHTAFARAAVRGVPLGLLAASPPARRRCRPLVPVLLRETALVSAVFPVRQIPTRRAAGDLATATRRALRIHRWERTAGLPDGADGAGGARPAPGAARGGAGAVCERRTRPSVRTPPCATAAVMPCRTGCAGYSEQARRPSGTGQRAQPRPPVW